MKNFLKLFALAMIIFMFAATLMSCSSDAEKLVGTWSGQSSILGVVTENNFVFKEDGTGSMSTVLGVNLAITYTVDEDAKTVSLTFSTLGIQSTTDFTYTIDGDSLTLTGDDNSYSLTRTK